MSDTPLPRRDLAEVLLFLGACDEDEGDAVPWSRAYGNDWERALAECPHRNWVLWLAGTLLLRGHLKAEILVTTACACARSVLHLVPAGEDRPRLALEAAEQWVRGKAAEEEVRAAADVLGSRAGDIDAPATAASNAAKAAALAATKAAAATRVDTPEARANAIDFLVREVARAAFGAANVVWPVRSETRRSILALVKRELGPALLKGLAAYAASLPAA